MTTHHYLSDEDRAMLDRMESEMIEELNAIKRLSILLVGIITGISTVLIFIFILVGFDFVSISL